MPRLSKRGVVQAVMETDYAAPNPVFTLNDGILCGDPDFTVDLSVLERNFTRNDLGTMPHSIGSKKGGMTFTTEIRSNGKTALGQLASSPLITRLLRAAGYSITASAAPSSIGPFPNTADGAEVEWARGGALTNTSVIMYTLEVVAGGASGAATVKVTSDTDGENKAATAMTSGAPFTFGTKGASFTPTFVGDLGVGQVWTIWLLPPGLMMQPVSDGFESIAVAMNKDGLRHVLLGAYATFSITATAGELATIEWTLMGKYTKPTDAAMVAPNYERTLPSQVEFARLRTGAFAPIVNEFTFDQANQIELRPDVNSEDGYIGYRMVDRAPTGGIDPEATLVAENDFWEQLANADLLAFQMRIGTKPGNIVHMIAPGVQYTGMTYQDRNSIQTYDAGLKFSRNKQNDDFLIFFC